MKAPLFVRSLSEEEHRTVTAGLRSSEGFTMRRSQILVASSKGQRPSEIARNLGCSLQMVRNVINAFHSEGLDCLRPKSRRPKTVQPIFDQERAERLRAILHQSPRTFGKSTSVWTLSLAAQVCFLQEFEVPKIPKAPKGVSKKSEEEPKALCCYGLLREDSGQMLLRFVDGRPVSYVSTAYLDVSTAYLEWVCERLAEEGKQVLVLIWDNASCRPKAPG